VYFYKAIKEKKALIRLKEKAFYQLYETSSTKLKNNFSLFFNKLMKNRGSALKFSKLLGQFTPSHPATTQKTP
jgi:hypothetical protein